MSLANKNLFSEKLHQQYTNIINENIPEIATCNHDNFYSLIEYYINSPKKYFNQNIAVSFFDYLNSQIQNPSESILIIDSIKTNIHELDQAIKGLDEMNLKKIHETPLSEQEVESMYEINNKYLYEYLKINDLILLGLIKPIAYFIRKKNNKGIDKLDIFNCIETIQSQNSFNYLVETYNHVVRNAIAHGSVQFNGNTIIFKDKKKEVTYSVSQFVRKFDELLDCVNGIVYSYRKFYLIYLYNFENNDIPIPNSIKINELKVKSEHYSWKILHNYDSTIQGRRQCNLFISTTLNSRDFMNISAYQTAAYLEKLLPNTYETLFIQIKTKYKMPCWQSFDMQKLRNYINYGITDIVTDGTYFFDEKLLGKKRDYLKGYSNLFIKNKLDYGKLIQIKYIKFHSKSSYNVIEKCCIVLNTNEIDEVKNYIRKNAKMLLNKAIEYKNGKSNFLSKQHLFPTKYIRVLIYSKNMRERTFKNSSFIEDNNLIAILHFNKSIQIKNILPSFGIIEENKHCTICWSKNHPALL